MAASLVIGQADLTQVHRFQWAVYTGPASYATGGDPVDPMNLRMGHIDTMLGGTASDGTTTYLLWYDKTNGKIKWFVPSTNVEVAAAVNLSTFTARIVFTGR